MARPNLPPPAPGAELAIRYVPVADVVRADSNPKDHAHDLIQASIIERGFAEPVLLDERTGKLVAGHGRLAALRSLEEHTARGNPAKGKGVDDRGVPRGIGVDDEGRWLLPVVHGWASRNDADAEAYLVASNRLVELGGWDERTLAELLENVSNVEPDLLDLTGYSADDLADLVAELEERAPDYPGAELADPPEGVRGRDGDSGDTDANTKRTNGLDDLRDEYETSETRMIVLFFQGARYVWMVEQLAKLGKRYGVDSNADAVMRLVEDAVEEQAPAIPDVPEEEAPAGDTEA